MKEVLNFIKSLNINNKIIVACSGGPDSMFLLVLLNSLGYNCVCAHVNHNVREASKDEYKFLKNYCEKHDIIFEGITINSYKNDKFSEEEAREFRYNFFETLINKYQSKYLFTAHHGDDLMETILMRIVRGSSLKGYRGFDMITDKGSYKIIRPLVYLTKEEIEESLKKDNIEYVIDESNFQDEHTRNRYRHYALPFFKKEDKNVHLKFLKYSKKIEECDNYFERLLSSYKDDIFTNNIIYIDKFNELDKYVKKCIVEKVISYQYPKNLYLVSDKHINYILNLINNNKDSLEINLPDNVIVRKEYGKVYFYKDNDKEKYGYVLKDKVIINGDIIKVVEESDDKSNYCIRLNSKDIKLPLMVRCRRDGDRMQIKNMTGSKKINDIFIDCKVSKNDRDTYPLLVDGDNKILWVPGLKKSNFDIPINDSYDIIIKYEKENY